MARSEAVSFDRERQICHLEARNGCLVTHIAPLAVAGCDIVRGFGEEKKEKSVSFSGKGIARATHHGSAIRCVHAAALGGRSLTHDSRYDAEPLFDVRGLAI